MVVTTDIPCASLGQTIVVVGNADSLDPQTPTTTTNACSNGTIGTLYLTPSGSINGTVAFEVVAGVGVDSTTCAQNDYASCVVARRALPYTPHTTLTVPIDLSSACIGKTCESSDGQLETCENGQCVPASVGPSCVDGTCAIDAGAPDATITDAGATDATLEAQGPLDASITAVDRLIAFNDLTCARITSNGLSNWYCWGDNSQGQVPITTQALATPTEIPLLVGYDQVALGTAFGCGYKPNGAMQCWGQNQSGQLGDGTMNAHVTPAATSSSITSWSAVAAGDAHACAISQGALYCWGSNTSSESGAPASSANVTVPTSLGTQAVNNWTAVTCGTSITCGIGMNTNAQATVGCFGSGASDQLGGWGETSATPITIDSAPTSFVAASSATICSGSSKQIDCWGDDLDDTAGTTTAPTLLATVGTPTGTPAAVARGHYVSCAIVSGSVSCWGANIDGELGADAYVSESATPVRVALPTNGVATIVAAGATHACALVGSGVYCWGANASHQLGNGGTSASSTPVAVTF